MGLGRQMEAVIGRIAIASFRSPRKRGCRSICSPRYHEICRQADLQAEGMCGELLIFGTNQQFATHTLLSNSKRRFQIT